MINETDNVMIDYRKNWYPDFKPEYRKFDENLPEYWMMKYSDRIKLIRDIKPDVKTLFDVGCGLGRAMRYYDALGLEVYGLEPSEYAYKHNPFRDRVFNDYFGKIEIKDTYDVVHIEQVLSHIFDWKCALQDAVKILKPGGVIVIEEPNDNNDLQAIIEPDKGKYWIVKDHCNYFNLKDKVLEKQLEKLGCNVKKVTATYPMEFFQLMGIKYLGNEGLGQIVHKMRFDLLKGMGKKRLDFKESMARLGWGRDLVILAQKGG